MVSLTTKKETKEENRPKENKTISLEEYLRDIAREKKEKSKKF